MKEKIMFDELVDDIVNRIDPAGHNTDGLTKHYRLKLSILVNQEVEKRIAERQLTDEQIEQQFTTPHYHYEKGHYYKVRKDRIFGAKWYRDRLVSQKTDNLKENNNNGSTN